MEENEEKLSEENLNTLEWALSFLHWYEKKYKKQHYLQHPQPDVLDSDEENDY